MPFFSVVIALYNKEVHIQNTLQSVLSQSFQDFEVIIVDDGSKDKSLEIVKNFTDKRITVLSQENQGASATRNKGITNATSQYIALLDADDIWAPTYLEEISNAIKTFPKESVFATAMAYKYDNKVIPIRYNFKESNSHISVKNYFENSLKYSIITSSSVVFNKEVLKKTGLFDLSIKSGQDTDLWIRFGMHFPVAFINKVLSYYVFNGASLSNTTFNPKDKPRFDKYLEEEKQNPSMKRVIDLNRYSMAILSKMEGVPDDFNYFYNALDVKNLPLKNRILLKSPAWLLKLLVVLKSTKGEKLHYRN